MAAYKVTGLHSHNFISGSEELIAVWHKTPLAYRSGSWIRGATLTDGLDAYMASYLDKVFLVNGTDNNCEYNGNYWTFSENTLGSPIAKYIISHESRLFLYNIKILGTRYPSRVWFCDLPSLGTVTWGLDYGTDLVTTAGDATITSATAHFKTRNIKIGDPFFITTGTNRGEYSVLSVTDDNTIELTENLTFTASGSSFWVGSNWFDVGTEDGDEGMGFGIASNEIVCLKKNSAYRYNVAGQTLRQIKDVPGTISPKSIVNWGGYCYWLHPSGIYRTGGGVGEKISNAIEHIFRTATVSDFTGTVAWVNQLDSTVNFSIGSATFEDGDSFTNLTISFDTNSKIFAYRDYPKNFKVAAPWLRSSNPEVYIGDDSSGVFQMDTGTSFDGNNIPCEVEYYTVYPSGEEAVVTFNRIRSYIKNGPDVQIFYKLIYKPTNQEDVWTSDETWNPMIGSQVSDRVDWYFLIDARASGVKIKVVESGADESFVLEKLTIYYSSAANS